MSLVRIPKTNIEETTKLAIFRQNLIESVTSPSSFKMKHKKREISYLAFI